MLTELSLRPIPTVNLLADASSALDVFEEAGFDRHRIALWANHSDPIFRRNRMQALKSVPLIVPILVFPTEDFSKFRRLELEAAIDRGDPLFDAVGRVMAVSRNAAQFFSKLVASNVGADWVANPLELLCAIHLTPVDFRPTKLADWDVLRTYWRYAGLEGSMAPCTWRNHLNEKFLDHFCRWGYQSHGLDRLQRITEGREDFITLAWDYFFFVDGWCEKRWPYEATKSSNGGPSLGVALLLRYSPEELIRQSNCWHQEVVRATTVRTGDGVPHFEGQFGSWPALLQSPYEKHGLHAVSLTTPAELIQEGGVLHHCVGTYAEDCVTGKSHIVSIRNEDGVRLSTAEIYLKEYGRGEWEPEVVQHYALGNSDPPRECHDILVELLDELRSPSSQLWLTDVQKVHAERQCDLVLHLMAVREISAAVDESVMRTVLPDYDETVAWFSEAALQP